LLMSFGYKINAVVILPVVSTLFLCITYFGAGAYRIKSDPRRHIPNTLEAGLHTSLKQAICDYTTHNVSHADTMKKLEEIAVEYKYKVTDYNASHTAELMQVPRSTLYSILERVGLKVKRKR
jgi:DNA-binding NtrC family response regulator